jgi:hypothetical protein
MPPSPFYAAIECALWLFISLVIILQLPSKRVMDGPSFAVNRAESSHQHVMAGPATLDPGRAEAASKHVRALNTQFARYVALAAINFYILPCVCVFHRTSCMFHHI